MRFRSVVLLFATLTVLARTGQAQAESISFEALVREAAAIVVVKPAPRPRSNERIQIAPAGKPADPRRYPPFEFAVHEYDVVKVLKGQGLGKRLRVYPADFDAQLRAHREQYLRGVSRPWIATGYEPQRPPSGTSTEPIVVFLRRAGGRWTFAAEGAVESSERAAEISALLARPR
jgi:hypothetical protein